MQRHKAHTLNLEIMMRLVENETLPAEEADDVRDLIEDYLERNQEDFDEFDVVDDMYESLNLEALATKESVKVVTNVKQLHEESEHAPAGSPQQLQTALSGGSRRLGAERREVPPPAPVLSVDESRGGRGGCATGTAKCKSMGIAVSQHRKDWKPTGLDLGTEATTPRLGAVLRRRRRGKPIPRPNNNSNAAPGAGGIKDGNAAQQAFPPGPRPLSSDANQQQSVAEAANAAFTAHEVFDNPSQGARSLNEMSTSIRRSDYLESGMQSGSGSAQSINNASNNSINSTLAPNNNSNNNNNSSNNNNNNNSNNNGSSSNNNSSNAFLPDHSPRRQREKPIPSFGKPGFIRTLRRRRALLLLLPPTRYPSTILSRSS